MFCLQFFEQFECSSGLDKLQSTTEEIKELQIQLEIMKPALEIAAKDADVMIKKIAADTVSLHLLLSKFPKYVYNLHFPSL